MQSYPLPNLTEKCYNIHQYINQPASSRNWVLFRLSPQVYILRSVYIYLRSNKMEMISKANKVQGLKLLNKILCSKRAVCNRLGFETNRHSNKIHQS